MPDYSHSDANGVRVTIPGGSGSLEFARLVFEQGRTGRPLGLDHLLILDVLRRERRTNASLAARVIQKSESVARSVLEQLVERGLIEAKGERQNRVYLLSAAVYRALGDATGYVRTRGFERIQQEAMVKEFVRAHGSIRRADVIELCALPARQATDLLGNMVARGLLDRKGSDRGTYYVERLG